MDNGKYKFSFGSFSSGDSMWKVSKTIGYQIGVEVHDACLTGKIDNYGSQILMYHIGFDKSKNPEHFKFWFDHRHRTMLPCYFPNEEEKHIAYAPYDMLFVRHLEHLRASGVLPVMSDVVICHGIGSSLAELIAIYVPEIFRKHFQDLFCFFMFIHELDHYTVESFDMSNLAIKGGDLQVFGVPLEHVTDVFVKADRIKQDFDRLIAVIKAILPATIPVEMTRWLELLNMPNRKMDFLKNHVAILQHDERLKLVANIDKRMDLVPTYVAEKLLFGLGEVGGWLRDITEQDGPLYTCKTYKHTTYHDPPSLNKTTTAALSLIRFWRNSSVHFKENGQNFKMNCSDDKVADAVLFRKYGQLIGQLQELAAKNNVLSILAHGK